MCLASVGLSQLTQGLCSSFGILCMQQTRMVNAIFIKQRTKDAVTGWVHRRGSEIEQVQQQLQLLAKGKFKAVTKHCRTAAPSAGQKRAKPSQQAPTGAGIHSGRPCSSSCLLSVILSCPILPFDPWSALPMHGIRSCSGRWQILVVN